ncbi:mitochondrial iron ion transporter [Scleroderma citrinum]
MTWLNSQPIPPWPLSNVPIMLKRCTKSTQPSSDASTKTDEKGSSSHDHPRDGHTHSHSIFHTHSHDEHAHGHDAEEILKALQGAGDRGSRITLIGLYSNIVLTGAKGIAAWYMNSASLLADAGHSLSDLLGDFVTLFCWKLSRKPPSNRYPYGFAKFETLGTTTVSLMLVGGALGIGFHSYHLLVQALATSIPTLPPGPLYDILSQVTSVAQHAPSIGHVHGHHGGALDPNAAWFAAISILAKEWLYRITKKVADEEHSPVLYANAVHHRSDAYSSVVALVSILGSWLFSALPLDPIGGMLVSVVILQQGYTLLKGAFAELTDAGVSKSIHEKLLHALGPLLSEGVESGNGVLRMLAIRHLRAKHTGSLILVDVTVDVPSTWTVLDTSTLEEQISCRLKTARTEVSDVRVKFCPVDVELES